jgi:hypothetical protein
MFSSKSGKFGELFSQKSFVSGPMNRFVLVTKWQFFAKKENMNVSLYGHEVVILTVVYP